MQPASKSVLRQWLLPATVASALIMSACGTLSNTPRPESGSNTTTQLSNLAISGPVGSSIAKDIVQVAEQIFPAMSTTLQFSADSNDPGLETFFELFADAGYGIQQVSADQGSHHFSYTIDEQQSDDKQALLRVRATVGAVQISRDYSTPQRNTISPASPFKLSGTRVSVDVPDQPTGNFVITDAAHSKATYVASLNLDDQVPPVISLITDELVDRVAAGNSTTLDFPNSLQGINSSKVEVNNLFYSTESNFQSLLDDRDRVTRQVIVFGDDSMVLGDINKQLIEQLASEEIESQDLISLVGCSNGPTALDIGNEGLALGRAERVTQALLSQGIARERILDEGCWAPVSAGEKFPNRGVVLEIWRQNT